MAEAQNDASSTGFIRNERTYCIPKSKFDSSHNPMFIGKCLDYEGNWPIISIIIRL